MRSVRCGPASLDLMNNRLQMIQNTTSSSPPTADVSLAKKYLLQSVNTTFFFLTAPTANVSFYQPPKSFSLSVSQHHRNKCIIRLQIGERMSYINTGMLHLPTESTRHSGSIFSLFNRGKNKKHKMVTAKCLHSCIDVEAKIIYIYICYG